MFDNGDFGRERYAEMIKEGERERFAAKVQRHQRKNRQQQNPRQNRQPRLLALLSSLAR